ncbi:pyridoxal phosphate-dependent aminotransferase, partial [Streptomyces hyaluromycini]
MRRTDPGGHRPANGTSPEESGPAVPEGHGPVRYGPPFPDDGLPVLPELCAVLAAAANRGAEEPVGGGPALL